MAFFIEISLKLMVQLGILNKNKILAKLGILTAKIIIYTKATVVIYIR